MSEELERQPIVLQEQCDKPVWLRAEDAALLQELKFDVHIAPLAPDRIAADHYPDQNCFIVNPKQYVAHLGLPSGTILMVKPKVDSANVFRMLAYVYAGWNRDVFQHADVLYSTDQCLFEPLVELLCELVAARVRRGLVQDYMNHEENLAVLRGRILFEQQVAVNAVRPDRLFCRYQQQTPDNEDNQIVKWTLRYLASQRWSTRTVHSLRVNLRHFAEVSLRAPSRGALSARVYNRMNDDYRLLHDFCRLFLENRAITERAGDWQFRGFLLDMNLLFEAFVTTAFSTVAPSSLTVYPQRKDLFSSPPSIPMWIRPDVTVSEGPRTAAIVDAKYKRLDGPFGNPDFYQMLAYGTVLRCNRAYLFYPATEWGDDAVIEVRNSPMKIHVRQIDIGHPQCVWTVERTARTVLSESTMELPCPPLATGLTAGTI
jgi:5-methylcytosine-specific restriction enzyme subunit McrC